METYARIKALYDYRTQSLQVYGPLIQFKDVTPHSYVMFPINFHLQLIHWSKPSIT